MKTKWRQAAHLTTRDQLVENGPRKREARPVSEVAVNGAAVLVRVRFSDGSSQVRAFQARDRVRVLA